VIRRSPFWLQEPLSFLSVRFARLDLKRYDFVYCFEPGVRMPASTPNVCWCIGPSFLDLPDPLGDDDGRRAPSPLKMYILRCLTPRLRPDPNSRYVTISDWIADLFNRTYGYRLPVIWPPTRTRVHSEGGARSHHVGFLFLSRLEKYKHPEIMLKIAQRFPEVPVTIAGATMGLSEEVTEIRCVAARMGLRNLTVVEDPTDDVISRLFELHSAFVFPARWEHFGIVTVEAIQAGLLPLVHDSGGQREIVPIDALRFKSETELVEKAAVLISTSPSDRREMLEGLQRHVARGSAENYRREMLLPLRQDLGLTCP
jgi:glycosyltransferase involved in cell wall biosynthesis